MNVLNFDARQCERIRRHLDAYLSNELSVETTGDVLRHLEACEGCASELEARTRLRDALRRAASHQVAPEELRQSIHQQLTRMQPRFLGGSSRLAWATALAGIAILVLAGLVTERRINRARGRQMVARVIAIGVADHVQCTIKGHNYPNVPNPPAKLREQLGPEYAGLLAVVQQKLPDFEILEAHLCSLPGSPRKYVHFITRGRGTILSVILTRREGEQLPNGSAFQAGESSQVRLYEAPLEGMNAAAFEANGYWGFVVSDLNRQTTLQIASALAPSLKAALEARADLRLLASPRWEAADLQASSERRPVS